MKGRKKVMMPNRVNLQWIMAVLLILSGIAIPQTVNDKKTVCMETRYMRRGKLSTNFTWEEMVQSETAKKHRIENLPDSATWVAIEELVRRTLQPLRVAYGEPILISSGYRCQELNKLVGGAPSSQHVKGEAADCVTDDACRLLGVLLAYKIPFDQAILYRKRNVLHVSLRSRNNRRKIIIND